MHVSKASGGLADPGAVLQIIQMFFVRLKYSEEIPKILTFRVTLMSH